MIEYSETNFPERLFILGGGPSLELLYPYRKEMSNWGYWVVQRADLVQPFLEFINPLYNISYKGGPCGEFNKAYGIPLERPLGDVRTGCSIGGFISHFQKFGGKELFLFGYNGGAPFGLWRDQPNVTVKLNNENVDIGGDVGIDRKSSQYIERYAIGCDATNKIYTEYTDWRSIKLYHLGKTRYNFMTEISAKELVELI